MKMSANCQIEITEENKEDKPTSSIVKEKSEIGSYQPVRSISQLDSQQDYLTPTNLPIDATMQNKNQPEKIVEASPGYEHPTKSSPTQIIEDSGNNYTDLVKYDTPKPIDLNIKYLSLINDEEELPVFYMNLANSQSEVKTRTEPIEMADRLSTDSYLQPASDATHQKSANQKLDDDVTHPDGQARPLPEKPSYERVYEELSPRKATGYFPRITSSRCHHIAVSLLVLVSLGVAGGVAYGIYAKTRPGPVECKTTILGEEYMGTLSTAKNGLTCHPWASTSFVGTNQDNNLKDPQFLDASINAAMNYCRDPDDSSEGPWCYTSYFDYEYCDVPFCDTLQCSYSPHEGKQAILSFFISGQRRILNNCTSDFVWKPNSTSTITMRYENWGTKDDSGDLEPSCSQRNASDPKSERESCIQYNVNNRFQYQWNDIYCSSRGCPLCRIAS